MIFKNLPKVTKVAGGAATLTSPEFALDNYEVVAFLFEKAGAGNLTVKVKGNTDGGTAVDIPFRFKDITAEEYTAVEATGKTVTDAGAFIAVILADDLAKAGHDRVAFALSQTGAELSTVYVLQTQPRYTE